MQHVKMTATNFVHEAGPGSATRSPGQAILPMLVPFPMACFVGALVTDLAYWQTPDVLWERFSIWLVTVGMILSAVAAIAGVIDLVRGRRMRNLAWPHAVGYVLAVGLSLINAFVHSRDGYTAVVPTGLALSALVVVILLFTGWFGSALVRRNLVGADR
jgi:uncharacterized membrane protein